MENILNDEPAESDELGREPYVRALATTVMRCETPFTVGVYGDWGSGKTTLLQLVKGRAEAQGAKCVWFNAWLHQRNDDPALALLHTIASELKLGQEAKKILAIVGATVASALLKVTTQINAEDIRKTAAAYEEEQFEQRDQRTKLREKFEAFIRKARGAEASRLVVFIDDLDRCDATQALAVLESLKLYLNVAGCVYVVAADRFALERAVEQKYGATFTGNSRYLDKIVQLPFLLPPIHPISLISYVRNQLGDDFEECTDLLVAGLGPNPRALKRFVNVLTLNDELASDLNFDDYEVRWLCIVLLIQYLDSEKYLLLSSNESALESILEKKTEEANPRLRAVLELAGPAPVSISPYIHLANVSSVDDVERAPSAAFMKPLKPSEALAKIVGDQPIARTEVTKRVWEYIKRADLQDKQRRTMINSDALLKAVVGKDVVSMFEMTKEISKHLSDPKPEGVA